MPIEFRCPQCGKLLRTPDASAGKKGKCPHCQSVNDIPLASTAPQEKPIDPLFPQTPAPRIERPDSKAPLAGPSADPFASPPGLSPYPTDPFSSDPFASLPSSSPAATPGAAPGQIDLFSEMPSSSPLASPSSAGPANPFGAAPSSAGGKSNPFGAPSPAPASTNPYSAPSFAASQPSYGYQSNLQAHRGGIVLALGIVGMLSGLGGLVSCCCCLSLLPDIVGLGTGIPAIVLGMTDLRKIRDGLMDPNGRGITMAGYVMGIVAVVLAALGIVMWAGWLIFTFVGQGMQQNQGLKF